MICELGKELGCKGMDKNNECTVYADEGVVSKVKVHSCIFRDIRDPKARKIEVVKKRNPLKAAKAAEKNKG